MEICPHNKKVEKLLTSQAALQREYGDMAGRIKSLLTFLRAAPSLQEVALCGRFHLHKLSGNRADQWAMRVSGNNRMLVISTDGETEAALIKRITIIELCIDYH